MSTPETVTLTVPHHVAANLRAAVEVGDYASTDEIAREALQDWSRARDAEIAYLRGAVRIGDESGPSIPPEAVYAELYAMIGGGMQRERV